MRVHIRLLGAFLLTTTAAELALATDGYFSNGYGTQCKGMAGACTAVAQGALGAATNPASMFWAGRRFDLGVELFNPNREFTVTGAPSGAPGTFGLAPGTVKSDSKMFVMPSFGANFQVRENTTFGVSMFGNGGMNTNYKAPVFGQTPTGVNLMQMFVTPTLAQRIAKKHSVGLTAILGWQQFKAEGLGAFSMFSSAATKLTNNGNSSAMGLGGKFGYMGEWSKYFTVGASYQTRVKMGKFDKYAGLFAEQGAFDVPPAYTGGVAVMPVEGLTISADVERIEYSRVKSIGAAMLPNLMTAQLGTAGGAGFGWKDVTVGRFGVQVAPVKDWTVRGGFSTGTQAVPASEVMFNILAPGVITKHATFGFTHALGNGRMMHMAVVRAFASEVKGYNPLEAPGRQQIGLKMNQWEVEVGFSFGVKK